MQLFKRLPNGGAKILGIEFAPIFIPKERRLQTACVIFYLFVFFVWPVFTPLYIYLIWCSNLWFLLIPYFIWMWFDWDTPKKGSRPWNYMKNHQIWRHLSHYFPVKLHKTVDLDPEKNYLFGYHPHGIMSVGAFTNFAISATGFEKVFPGMRSHLITLVGQFWFPFRREFIMWFDVHDSSKESISKLLSQETKGHCVVVVVGGSREAAYAGPGHFDLTLRKRKGFIKLAIRNGVDLVPVFSFGENDIFMHKMWDENSILRKLQWLVKSLVSIPPLFIYGRGIFNYTFGYLPFRRPINTVVGKPIAVEKCAEPSAKIISEIHQKYCVGLIEVFEENKAKFGIAEDVHLNIDL